MRVAYVLYNDFTMLDIVGPFNVISSVPGTESVWVAESPGAITDHTRSGALVASAAFDELTDVDLVVVPGGLNTHEHLQGPVVEWLRKVHPKTRWTTSVCTGSLLLGAAGLLDGIEATSHWGARGFLTEFGAKPVERRVVLNPEKRIATAAGVSAGIDMALSLVAEIFGVESAEAVQLAIEYDPAPPVDSGSLQKASPETIRRATESLQASSSPPSKELA
jgi:transcriptional regulator GlxA family with amidase domain